MVNQVLFEDLELFDKLIYSIYIQGISIQIKSENYTSLEIAQFLFELMCLVLDKNVISLSLLESCIFNTFSLVITSISSWKIVVVIFL